MTRSDEYWMREALREAEAAFSEDEVPVGAVVVCNDRVIGRGHNQTERLTDVTAHAEMLALTAAQQNLGGRVLPDCTLYVTVEPCYMCAGAIGWARPGRLVWGRTTPNGASAAITAGRARCIRRPPWQAECSPTSADNSCSRSSEKNDKSGGTY